MGPDGFMWTRAHGPGPGPIKSCTATPIIIPCNIGVRDCPYGYVVPGCVEDGTWMLWENSSVVVIVAAFWIPREQRSEKREARREMREERREGRGERRQETGERREERGEKTGEYQPSTTLTPF